MARFRNSPMTYYWTLIADRAFSLQDSFPIMDGDTAYKMARNQIDMELQEKDKQLRIWNEAGQAMKAFGLAAQRMKEVAQGGNHGL